MIEYIFYREGGFYPLTLNDDADAVRNAECNPGTIRVENAVTREPVWQGEFASLHDQTIVPWPTTEDIWMGKVDNGGVGDWFPLQTMALRDDLPTREEIERARAGERMPPRAVLRIVAEYPQPGTTVWANRFQGNHPIKEWRRCTIEELARAKHFYGLDKKP